MISQIAIALLSVVALLSGVSADVAPSGAVYTCSGFEKPVDKTCHVFSPFTSALPKGKSEQYINSMKASTLVCGKKAPESIGLFLCYGTLGNCANLPWWLPKNESDLKGVVEFYNKVKLSELNEEAKKRNAADRVLCKKVCDESIAYVRSCPSLFAGFEESADPCSDLPDTNCVDMKTVAQSNANTTSTDSSKTNKPGNTSGVEMMNANLFTAFVGLVAVLSFTL
ncbi:hypothetical protein BKA69DRAFT_1049773 [Paraphysoderma sedebokerense]|nr:hypothetical protein BKA69DRAFT_1049773 [Paraphysoderma sedebokerense]